MGVRLGRLILYARDVETAAEFYARHFGFTVHREEGDRIVELTGPDGGAVLMLHPAGKAKKQGQTSVKLVFDIEDVQAFCDDCRENGLEFGPLHRADGYVFANAKDPCGNSISMSSRAFRMSG